MRAMVVAALVALAAPAGADVLITGSGSCAGATLADVPAEVEVTGLALTLAGPDGPMPALHDAVAEAAEAGVPVGWVLMEQMELIDDAGLEALLEEEVLEILAAAGLPDGALVVQVEKVAVPEGGECLLSDAAFAELIAVEA